jgi:hypothetical protein
VSEFIVKTTITGPQATIEGFRTQFLDSFAIVEKDDLEEIIVTLSGSDLDPRPTLLNLSCEFPALTFSVVEYAAHLGEQQASHRWIAQDGKLNLRS